MRQDIRCCLIKMLWLSPILTVYLLLPYCNALGVCKTTSKIPKVDQIQCLKTRDFMAKERHYTILLSTPHKSHNLSIPCATCPGENIRQFEWRMIPRTNPLMFKALTKPAFDNDLGLDMTKATNVQTTGKACYDKKSLALNLIEITMPDSAGTYLCQNKAAGHASNYIWYHVDFIPQAETTRLPTSAGQDQVLEMDNFEQVKAYQNQLAEQLRKTEKSEISPTFRQATKLNTASTMVDRCGPMKVKQQTRCYVGVPKQLFKHGDQRLSVRAAYGQLTRAFNFLRSDSKISRKTADRLGFQSAYFSDAFTMVPCEFSMFPVLAGVTDSFKSYPLIGYHAETKYFIKCPAIETEKILGMAKMGVDFSFPSKVFQPFAQLYALTIQQLVVVGQRNVTLTCGKTRILNCTYDPADVIWRSNTSRFTFTRQKSDVDNIYVTPECHLHFISIGPYDLDTYSCYHRMKAPRVRPVVWSPDPRHAYRLVARSGDFVWTYRQDAKVGAVLLVMWTVIITVGWVVMLFYNRWVFKKFDHCVTGSERTEQLRKTYKPFSDDLPEEKVNFIIKEW